MRHKTDENARSGRRRVFTSFCVGRLLTAIGVILVRSRAHPCQPYEIAILEVDERHGKAAFTRGLVYGGSVVGVHLRFQETNHAVKQIWRG